MPAVVFLWNGVPVGGAWRSSAGFRSSVAFGPPLPKTLVCSFWILSLTMVHSLLLWMNQLNTYISWGFAPEASQ
eukprot:1150342-Pelagomonas_calceolata.AAC.13